METLTIPEFMALQFVFDTDETVNEFEHYDIPNGPDANGMETFSIRFNSVRAGFVTATCRDIIIKFDYTATGGEESYTAAHEFKIEMNPDCDAGISTEGITLIDDDGDPLENWELKQVMIEKFVGAEWEQQVLNELPEPETEDLTSEDDTTMKTITVKRDDAPDLRFQGECIGKASSNRQYSNGRWTELNLYKTKSDKFVCEEIGYTQWQGEHDKFSGAVCDNKEEIIKFFGTGWLAKELYDDAEIECVEDIE